MITHEEFKAKAMQDPEFKAEYDGLAPEFALLCASLEASKTQVDNTILHLQ